MKKAFFKTNLNFCWGEPCNSDCKMTEGREHRVMPMLNVSNSEEVPIRLTRFDCVHPHWSLNEGALCKSEEVSEFSMWEMSPIPHLREAHWAKFPVLWTYGLQHRSSSVDAQGRFCLWMKWWPRDSLGPLADGMLSCSMPGSSVWPSSWGVSHPCPPGFEGVDHYIALWWGSQLVSFHFSRSKQQCWRIFLENHWPWNSASLSLAEPDFSHLLLAQVCLAIQKVIRQ